MIRVITVILIFLMMFLDPALFLDSEDPGYYTVIPSLDDPFKKTKQCLTLSQFANSPSDYLIANTLYFLPGEHNLDSTVLIENINTFNVMSSRDSSVTIVCDHFSARFEFHNVSVVHISGLTFIGCAGNKFTNINQFTLEDSQFIEHRRTALELIETSVTFIRTEISHNYGGSMISLPCENGNDFDTCLNFL